MLKREGVGGGGGELMKEQEVNHFFGFLKLRMDGLLRKEPTDNNADK